MAKKKLKTRSKTAHLLYLRGGKGCHQNKKKYSKRDRVANKMRPYFFKAA